MANEDGTLWVIFNGEIYNHAEIRAELESRGGHRWKTDHSDTEVILHAFEQWGIRGEGKPVQTFSIGYDGEYKSYQNELYYARKMAAAVGASRVAAAGKRPARLSASNGSTPR